MITIAGKVYNDKKVAYALGYAPQVFRRRLLGGLLAERNYFVGGKGPSGNKVDGVFRRKLLRKKNSKGTPWPINVVRIFRGEVNNAEKIDGMKLVMGAGIRKQSEFVQIMNFLGNGGAISNDKFMPIPVYRNLPDTKTPYKTFKRMYDSDELVGIREGNRFYWFRKHSSGMSDDHIANDLLFVGVKNITVSKQFDFEGDWTKRIPKAIDRLQKTADKAVDDINAGKVK